MNIQQLRYVVAVANNGTIREAAVKLFLSQPSLSVAIKDLEEELGFQIFSRTTTGTVLTRQGMIFYEKALEMVKDFDSFEKYFSKPDDNRSDFSIASQHYDFLAPLLVEFSREYPDYTDISVLEATTIQILDHVAQGESQIGIIYINNRNYKGLSKRMESLGLEMVDLLPFKTHIYLSKVHPLAQNKTIFTHELKGLPLVRFSQEKDEYLYYSENLMDTTDSPMVFNVMDRATLNGILERTLAFSTGSGFLDSMSFNGIVTIPLEDDLDNKLVYVKRSNEHLSSCALKFIELMKDYFKRYNPKELK